MMTSDGACFIPEKVSPCSGRCHETLTTDGACFIPSESKTMLCPFSWDDDNWWSKFQSLEIDKHALSIVMSWWQQAEHLSCLRCFTSSDRCHETMTTDGTFFLPFGLKQCSVRWHGMMTTDRACLNFWGGITMLWPFSWIDDKWQSMFHTWGGITLLWLLSWDDDT